jgi:hypothetical protein
MKELSEKASVAEVGQHLPVAQEIVSSEDGAQVVAFLLKSYFANRASEGERHNHKRSASNDNEAANDSGRRTNRRGSRRRRRRSRRNNNDENHFDANEGAPPEAFVAQETEPGAGDESAAGEAAPVDNSTRLRVNIGFDDGFKGRGAVAKKISALAGLNDGIVKEVESRRDHAILKASPEIAELVIERVDGAQLGKKTITVHVTT